MSEYIISDEQIREAVEFTPPYKTLSYVAKYRISGAVNIDGIYIHSLQEIVRCRDCKHYRREIQDEYDGSCWCAIHAGYVDDMCFCAWAERREP